MSKPTVTPWWATNPGPLIDCTSEARLLQRSAARRPRYAAVVLTFFTVAALWWRLVPIVVDAHRGNVHDVYNRTLGFERNFVISMPSRTDRHDTFALAASYAEFDFELFDGVEADKIITKALPVTWNTTTHPMGRLGCWRANMNLLQKIVRERIQTALIFQDDADFDVTIKHQLAQYARGVRALQGTAHGNALKSPYGSNWDALWLGHSSIAPTYDPSQFYVIEDDPTVPPVARRHGLFLSNKLPAEALSDTTRTIFKVHHSSWGLAAYAVTYEGARKVLAALSLSPNNDATDLNLSKLCGGNMGMAFTCYAAYPTLIGVHRPEGPSSRDSEIHGFDKAWHKAYSFDIVYSMKQNVLRLARGDEAVNAQWPNEVRESSRVIGQQLRTGQEYLKQITVGKEKQQRVPGVNDFRTLDGGISWEQGLEQEEAWN